MDWFDETVKRLAAGLSHLVEPVMLLLDRIGHEVRHELDIAGVPLQWQSAVVTVLWVVVLFIILRTLEGWLRLLVLAVALVVLARAYGLLPGS